MEEFKCEHCNLNLSTNSSRTRHYPRCKVQKQKQSQYYLDLEKKFKELQDKFDYSEKCNQLEGIKRDYDNRIDFDSIPYIFSDNHLETWINSIQELGTIEQMYSSLLKHDNIKLYWLGDHHRQVFYFRGKLGNKVKDEKCKKLREYTRDILKDKLISMVQYTSNIDSNHEKEIDSVLNKIDSKEFPKLVGQFTSF